VEVVELIARAELEHEQVLGVRGYVVEIAHRERRLVRRLEIGDRGAERLYHVEVATEGRVHLGCQGGVRELLVEGKRELAERVARGRLAQDDREDEAMARVAERGHVRVAVLEGEVHDREDDEPEEARARVVERHRRVDEEL
jgi:hypothetical protein